MAITNAQQAKQLLANGGMSLQEAKDMAPKGEFLAYINPKEAKMLKAAGGSGIMTKAGIPSFVEYGGAEATAGAAAGGEFGGGSPDDTFGGGEGRDKQKTKIPQTIDLSLLDPDPEVDVPTRDRKDTITKFEKNLYYNVKANPFSIFSPTMTALKTAYQTAKARNLLGLTNTTDDDNTGNGEGENDFRETMIAQQFTPYQQDVVKDTEEELSPVALALQQRDLMGGPRAFAAGGGIMDLEQARQGYKLGKLVKKIGRSLKKIGKSDVGKAALAAAATFKLGDGSFGDLFTRGVDSGFKFSNIGERLGSFLPEDNKDKLALAASLGLTAAPFLFQDEEDDEDEYRKFLESKGALGQGIDIQGIRSDPYNFLARPFRAEGGIMRLGFDDGDKDLSKDANYKGWKKTYEINPDAAEMNENHKRYLNFYERNKNAQAEGSKEPVAKKTMPLLDMGGQEMDLRAEGGFVPIGRMEKADDVPARLSKNEFVFTAEAVRNAGEGDVDKGAEVMYNMMKNLESGGDVSEESQGLDGARKMFQTSQ